MDLFAPSAIGGLNISVTGTATSLLSLINTAAASSFADTANSFNKLDGLNITPEDGSVRISFFPSLTPTATAGYLLQQGIPYCFRFKDLDNVKLIATSGTVKCSVEVGQSRPGETDVIGGASAAASAAAYPAGLGLAGVGELQGSATALQLPSLACKMVKFKTEISNAGNVYIGGSGVTKPDGTTDTSTGLELAPGDESGWIPISNLNLLYRICDNAGDDLTYIALT